MILRQAFLLAAAPAAVIYAGALAGFGTETPGGRGGAIIKVTNLNPAGPGSLRAALQTKGPRIVVFEVGGVIDLAKDNLSIAEPLLTIAGETAPFPGITLIRGGISIRTHDVVMRHIRVRMGDAGMPKKSGWEPEVTTSGPQCYRVVVDHCSMSWAVDENLSVSGPRYDGPEGTSRRVTLSNNILAEGLYNATHTKGIHSMGTLVHDTATDIAVIGNLYAHNNQRNPYFKANTTGAIVNNLIYNPGTRAVTVDWPVSEWEGRPLPRDARVSVVGNVLYHGANTAPGLALVMRKGDVYMEDNLAFDRDGKPAPLTAGDVRLLKDKPAWPVGLRPLPAAQVAEYVLRHAGARPKDRDEADLRIVRQFRERQGKFIDSQEEVGGYPRVPETRRALAVPKTGVEAWLEKFAAEVE